MQLREGEGRTSAQLNTFTTCIWWKMFIDSELALQEHEKSRVKAKEKTNASVSGQREPVCGYHKKQGRVGAKCGWYFMAPHLW